MSHLLARVPFALVLLLSACGQPVGILTDNDDEARGGADLCEDDGGCDVGQVCSGGICGAAPDLGCGSTADCPLDTFCNSSVGDCVPLPATWCRADRQCVDPEAPLCSNQSQGQGVPGSCVACIVDDDCDGDGEACVSPGLCLAPTSCPPHATPAYNGVCLCDPGYLRDGDACRADPNAPQPDGCPELDVTCQDFGFAGGTVVRSQDCLRIDIGSCVDVCGDGEVGPSEQCDGAENPFVCEDFGLVSGTLGCNPSTCRASAVACVLPVCGNDVREADELCDGDDTGSLTCADVGFTEGVVACRAGCVPDTTGCTFGDEREENDTPATANRNRASFTGQVNPASDQDCMRLAANAGDVVVADVLDVDNPVVGACAGDANLTLFLGDTALAFNENFFGRCPHIEHVVVDAGALAICVRSAPGAGTFPYLLRAAARPVVCGDGVADGNEACDGDDVGGVSCASLGGVSGTVSCAADCTEVDESSCVFFGAEREPNDSAPTANAFDPTFTGQINPAGEQDCMELEAAAGDVIRADLVGVESGEIGACASDPTLTLLRSDGSTVTSNDDSNGLCSHITFTATADDTYALCVRAFSSGSTFAWRLQATATAPTCGDGFVTGGEVCDGDDLGGASCFDVGGTGGTPACNADCTAVDTAGCTFPVCGNGSIEGNEVCDGGTRPCTDFGFTSGDAGCSADCTTIDTSACLPVADEIENNDTASTANPFAPAFIGNITAGNQDCMLIAAVSGQRIVADLVDIETGAVGGCTSDPTLTLFENDSQLSFSDDSNGLCPHIDTTVLSSGPFALCVRGFSSSASFRYRLDASAR
ncbi:MAG: hypothetical protein Q8O67_03080 [Deltaproteobacteria bacterium]|nr:hypothetical protein [Deltaproteobacteria bacterium]